jgi:hypothetical protein
MDMDVTLTEGDWTTLLKFVDGWLQEIAQYDDEDEEYLAVKAVRGKIDEQLRRG